LYGISAAGKSERLFRGAAGKPGVAGTVGTTTDRGRGVIKAATKTAPLAAALRWVADRLPAPLAPSGAAAGPPAVVAAPPTPARR
jgi:hypothetical protein